MNTLLKESVDVFMGRPHNFGDIFQKAHQLHDLFAPLAGVTAGDITDKDIMLPQGKAISPIKAAFCLKEGYRTSTFITGIYQAIRSLQESFPGERIRILYAGCGPYATLLTPLTAMFTPEEVSFYLLDVNPDSIAAVEKLYEKLELKEYVHSITCADAITYKMETPMHLVISETMLNALYTEPQVAIMLNLVPQLMEKAVFIPQQIRVSLQLLNIHKENAWMSDNTLDPERINLGDVYVIGQDDCRVHEETTFTIPERIGNNSLMVLLTDITIFGEEKLTINECSLNMPKKIMHATGHEGKKISFLYQQSEKPGFIHRISE